VSQRRSKTPIQLGEIVVNGGKTIQVVRSDPGRSTLSGVAKAEYNDWQFWPLVWDLNRDKVGPNPNRLSPGLQSLVLPLTAYTAQEQMDARRRAPSWRNYPA